MGKSRDTLRYLAIAGNVGFVAWILYNGVDISLETTTPQLYLYGGMIVILLLNAFLLGKSKYARYTVMAWNVLFAIWFLYSWIGHTQATVPELASLLGLTCLLALNTFLLYRK